MHENSLNVRTIFSSRLNLTLRIDVWNEQYIPQNSKCSRHDFDINCITFRHFRGDQQLCLQPGFSKLNHYCWQMMRAEKLIVKTIWISSDVWTAYCESSSSDIVDSYFVLAITMHFMRVFLYFARPPSQITFPMVFPWINTVLNTERFLT